MNEVSVAHSTILALGPTRKPNYIVAADSERLTT